MDSIFADHQELEDLMILPPRLLDDESIKKNYFSVIHFHVGVPLDSIFEKKWTDVIDKIPADQEPTYTQQSRINEAMNNLHSEIKGSKAYKNYYFGQYALKALLLASRQRLLIKLKTGSYNHFTLRKVLREFRDIIESEDIAVIEAREIAHRYHQRWNSFE